MSRSDLLVSLVRAGVRGDKAALRSTVEALAADERAKRHAVLADRLTKALNGAGSSAAMLPQPIQSTGHEVLAERTPMRRLDELILPAPVLNAVSGLIEEQHRADLLRSHGLQPRHRILLSGPPGNGKSTLAEAIAEALATPFFAVRYDMLISSFLGETNQRLRKLFEYARTTPCVLLFDEFDAVGKERGDVHETGEIKRVVSGLLLQIDLLPSYVVVIAATNHQELLDRAVWRRFELRLELPNPAPKILMQFVQDHLHIDAPLGARRLASIEKALSGVSFAEAEIFCQDVRRQRVLRSGEYSTLAVIDDRLKEWNSRLKVSNAGRPDQTTFENQRPRPRRSRSRKPADHTSSASGATGGPE